MERFKYPIGRLMRDCGGCFALAGRVRGVEGSSSLSAFHCGMLANEGAWKDSGLEDVKGLRDWVQSYGCCMLAIQDCWECMGIGWCVEDWMVRLGGESEHGEGDVGNI